MMPNDRIMCLKTVWPTQAPLARLCMQDRRGKRSVCDLISMSPSRMGTTKPQEIRNLRELALSDDTGSALRAHIAGA